MVTTGAPKQSLSPQQLYLALRRQIEEGGYGPGAWIPTERQLSIEFGVDRSTVRLAIARLEEHGLIEREPGRRPWVKHHGKSIETPPSEARTAPGTVAAVMPMHPVYPATQALLYGLNDALTSAKNTLRVHLFDTYGKAEQANLDREEEALRAVAREGVSGAVVWHSGACQTVPLLRRLVDDGVPLVLVDRHPDDGLFDFVGVDNRNGVEEAVEYLTSLGHRRIASLTTSEDISSVVDRRKGYHEALLRAGIEPRPEWEFAVTGIRIQAGGQQLSQAIDAAIDAFLSLREPPTGVIAANDPLAHALIAGCRARGISVPGDLSVVGFDDLDRYSPQPATLTTVRQPFEKIGRRAAELLLDRMNASGDGEAKQHVLLPTSLIVRSTCRSL